MTSSEIRSAFLKYFESKGHEIVASSSLVPEGDATLMFANAGMNQFKDVFTGQVQRKVPRATTSQKCVRAGGKHNDLENVGKTSRHHTFFEMLGNFSFGNYFKEGAISHAWEFLTEVMKLPKDRLWITIHDSDAEAGALWEKIAKLPKSRIVAMGDKDNFWAMGDTGPCGPCSEIHFDQGANVGCKRPECSLECDCDRYLEIWNLVFMQFEQKADGSRIALPNPSIDTGMGLERLCAVVGGFESNYDTDLFTPLLEAVAKISAVAYDRGEAGTSHRVLADHIKAATFLIGDGILPSNEGRGYVLRRIMRRAIRHAYLLGCREVILPKLCHIVLEMYAPAYPQLIDKKERILELLEREEQAFMKTISKGLQMFDQNLADWKKVGLVPGEVAFKLYDTFGFPLDLTETMAEQEGLKIDQTEFDHCMAEQRRKAQAASMFKTSELQGLHWTVLSNEEQTFCGYERLDCSSSLLRYTKTASGQCLLAPQTTCFYAESGGQVGDRGEIELGGNTFQVVDVQLIEGLRTLVLSPEAELPLDLKTDVQQRVDKERRHQTMSNHTCTHLLHLALQEILGPHAEQRGSWVGPTHLRFDFPHTKAIERPVLQSIEQRVNDLIQSKNKVSIENTSLDAAKVAGVTALFGEKYGDEVRVVHIGNVSKELCGGTHLQHSSEALAFVIQSEASVASGIRRIEAITGPAALKTLFENRQWLKEASMVVQSQPQELKDRIESIQSEQQTLKKELSHLKQSLVLVKLQDKLKALPQVGSIPYLAEILPDLDAGDLRLAADKIRHDYPDLPILLATKGYQKAAVLISFPKTWVKEKGVHAGNCLKPLGKYIEGGGGGTPELAQAGGKNPAGLPEVLKGFKQILADL